MSVAALLRSFLAVQEQRARLYTQFKDSFEDYLSTRRELPHQAVLTAVTTGFSQCSNDVIALEKALSEECRRPDLAAMLRQVQQLEREKLHLTITMQALKRAFTFGLFSWQREELVQTKHTLNCIQLEGACGCGQESDGIDYLAEYEYHAAVREAVQAMNSTIIRINEVLEDVRYALED